MTNVILISGKARSGKDTLAQIIYHQLQQQGHKVLVAHFADLVKYIAATFFRWNGQKDKAGRDLLQYIGTDKVRSKFPSFWVDFINNVLTAFENEWDYVLIADCRFKNEITVLKSNPNLYCTTLRVVRNNFATDLTPEQQNHQSEIELDDYAFDYVLHNDGNLKDLQQKAKEFIRWLQEEVKCDSL